MKPTLCLSLACALIIAAVAWTGASRLSHTAPAAAGGEALVSGLLSTREQYDPTEVRSALNSLEQASSAGAAVPWDQLIAEALQRNFGAWQEVLLHALEHRDLATQRDILAEVARWGEQGRDVQVGEASGEMASKLDTVFFVFRWATRSQDAGQLRQTDEYVALLRAYARVSALSPSEYSALGKAVADLQDAVAQSEIAFTALTAHGDRYGALGTPFVDALTPDQRAHFRAQVEAASIDGWRNNQYPLMEASALADLGDPALPEILRRHIASAEEALREGVLDPSEERRLAGFISNLRQYVEMVEAQRPPSGLVDFVTAPGSFTGYRSWALQRALELGVPRPELEAAVRDYIGAVENRASSLSKLDAQDLRYRTGVFNLVRMAADLGLLPPDDPLVENLPEEPHE